MDNEVNKKKLFVGNLAYSVRDDALRAAFEQCGTVESAMVLMDKFNPNRSKGFGFVEMSTEEEAQAAIEMWHDKELEGRPLLVNIARPKTERPPRDNNDRYNSF